MPKKRRSKVHSLSSCEAPDLEHHENTDINECNDNNRTNATESCNEHVCSTECKKDTVTTRDCVHHTIPLALKKTTDGRSLDSGRCSEYVCSVECKRDCQSREGSKSKNSECKRLNSPFVIIKPGNTDNTTDLSEGASTKDTRFYSHDQKSESISFHKKILDVYSRYIRPRQDQLAGNRNLKSNKDTTCGQSTQTEDGSYSKVSLEDKVLKLSQRQDKMLSNKFNLEEEINVYQEKNECPDHYFFSYATGYPQKHSLRRDKDDVEGLSTCLNRGEPVKQHEKCTPTKRSIFVSAQSGDGPVSCEEICIEPKHRCSNGVCWITSTMAFKHFPSKWLGAVIRESLIFFLFLICLSTAILSNGSSTLYYYCRSVDEFLLKAPYEVNYTESLKITKNFYEINSISDQWSFIRTVFVPNVYISQVVDEKLNASNDGMEMLQSVLVGVPRMRQVRVKPDECEVPSKFKNAFKVCYNYFSSSAEDTRPFGTKEDNGWKYSEDPHDRTYFGKISYYFGGGYSYIFSNSSTETNNNLGHLYNNSWIDRGTRAVFLDFTLYSPTENYFHIIKLVMELGPSGGVVPSAHCYTMKFFHLVSYSDYFLLGVEAFIALFVLYYSAQLVRELVFFGRFYILIFWGVYDILLLMLSYTYIAFLITITIKSQIEVDKMMESSFSDSKYFLNLSYIAQLNKIFQTFSAVYLSIVFIKMFKFLNMSGTYKYLTSSISYCCLQLICHIFIMTNILVMFGVIGHALFGAQVLEFSSVGWSFFTLATAVFGSINYTKMLDSNFIMAPIFTYCFFLMLLVLIVNFFVAIVSHAYFITCKKCRDKQSSRLYLGDSIMRFAMAAIDKDDLYLCETVSSSSSCCGIETKPKTTECYFTHVDPLLLNCSNKMVKARTNRKCAKPLLKQNVSSAGEKHKLLELKRSSKSSEREANVKVSASDRKYQNQLMIIKNRVDSLDKSLDQLLVKTNMILETIVPERS